MNILIEHIKKEFTSGDFKRAWDANIVLLEYDLSRAKNEIEKDNARKEYNFRDLLWFRDGYNGKPCWKSVAKFRGLI